MPTHVVAPYQKQGVQQLEAWGIRGILADDMGLGKTLQALHLIRRNPAPTTVVCPASVKGHWAAEANAQIGMRATVLEGQTPPAYHKDLGPLVVVNYDILSYWIDYLKRYRHTRLIVDECFPAGTLIATSAGQLPIDLIVKKQLPVSILCCNLQDNGIVERPIVHYFSRDTATQLLVIKHSSGSFICTENHRIWVEGQGYVHAKCIRGNSRLRLLQKGICQWAEVFSESVLFAEMLRQYAERQKRRVGYFDLSSLSSAFCCSSIPGQALKNTKEILFRLLCKQSNNKYASASKCLQDCGSQDFGVSSQEVSDGQGQRNKTETLGRHDGAQSYAQIGSCSYYGRDENAQWDFAAMEGGTGRQWQAYAPAAKALRIVRGGLGFGNSDILWTPPPNRLPLLLQSGYREQNNTTGDRNRWGRPQAAQAEGIGQQKRCLFDIVRVESIEIYKPANRHGRGGDSGTSTRVYNIEVAEHHNYFANGILVSNCQYIQNRESLRTRVVTEYSRQCSQAVALSGTPLTQKPAELWPTLNIVRPDLFPSFWSYAQEFCRPRLVRGRWTFGGARNVPKLHKILVENCMVRRLKKDVLQELPAIVRYVVPMELSRPGEYAQARDRFLKWLITSGAGSVASARKNERLTQMGYLKQLAAQLKCRAVVEWVNSYLDTTDEKLLLFAVHHKMMDALQRQCKAKSVLIHGGVTGADRKAAIAQFRGDANTRLCIAQIVAVGTGTDGLQAAAQSCAFAELDWRPGIHTQAEARLDRIGQKGSVTSHWLIALGTIEEQLCSVIEKKQSIISGVLDGGPLESDLDVFSQIEQLMLGQANAHQNQ